MDNEFNTRNDQNGAEASGAASLDNENINNGTALGSVNEDQAQIAQTDTEVLEKAEEQSQTAETVAESTANNSGVYEERTSSYTDGQSAPNTDPYASAPQNRSSNPYGGNNANPYSYRYDSRAGQNPYGNAYGNGYTARNPYAGINSDPITAKEPSKASKGFVVGMVALGMVVCLVLGFVFSASLYGNSPYSGDSKYNGGDSVNFVVENEQGTQTPVTDKGISAYVASVAANSVVEVSTETVSTNSFFGNYVTKGAGSGVIISSDKGGSYIITCAHVIDGATKVTVTLKDGSKYDAEYTAKDVTSDIGIIKINVKGLTVATIADISDLTVGEPVVAIGNPLGSLGGSVTNGIISALNRDVIIDGTTYNVLQTNAAINPGNSGGGLFDANGHLIGIVNAKSSGENIEGLGFAIPINQAIKISEELIKHGYVTGRVQLGFSLIEVLDRDDIYTYYQYAKYFSDYGVYIIESQDSKFKTGDRLIAINNIATSNISDVKSMLLKYKVGDKVTVTISRLNSSNKAEIMNIELVLTEKKS